MGSSGAPRFGMRYAARSEVGMIREANTDAGFAGSRLLVVADGTGPGESDGLASALAVEKLRPLNEGVPPGRLESAMDEACRQVNAAIRSRTRNDPALHGMETSIAAMLWTEHECVHVGVGSSQGYVLRDGELFLMPNYGGEQALKGGHDVQPGSYRRSGLVGDRYLLCSDGLPSVVEAQDMFEALHKTADPDEAVRQLVELANRNGGPDSITCVVAELIELRTTPPQNDAEIVVGTAAYRRTLVLPTDVHAGRPAAPRYEPVPEPADGPQRPESPVIPGFEVGEPLGEGGFAVVYRARQLSLNRPVAIKVLHERLEGGRLRRFEREVDAALRLSGHRNVVAVHDRGELTDGRPYLVMEFCEGGSLGDRLRTSGPLPPGEVREIGVKAADALAVAHRAGILHRDIKPDNLLVTRFEPVALADFGIAKLVEPDGDASATVQALTPAYAPPEMFDPDYTGPTTAGDVYSLAATLYALLSGLPPHHPGRPLPHLALMAHYVRAKEQRVSDIPGVPVELMSVIRRALHHRPERRYRTADTFAAALRSG